MSIAVEIERIQSAIAAACGRSGRRAEDVRLLAVSKTQSIELIEEAYAAGQRDFGENYVQELADKRARLAHLAGIRWHFIGHLQTNKAKTIAACADVFHALDSEKLARALDQRIKDRAPGAGGVLPVFIQVNIDDEASKSGVSVDDARRLADVVRGLTHLELRGLMCIPRPQETSGSSASGDAGEGARASFRRLAGLARELGGPLELSMGMSSDLEIAVEEGSSWVRVGSRIFGERRPKA